MNTKAGICWDLMGLPGLARELKSIVFTGRANPKLPRLLQKNKKSFEAYSLRTRAAQQGC